MSEPTPAGRPLLDPETRLGRLRILGIALDRHGERLHRARDEHGDPVTVEVLDWPAAADARAAVRAARRSLSLVHPGRLPLIAVGGRGRRTWRVMADLGDARPLTEVGAHPAPSDSPSGPGAFSPARAAFDPTAIAGPLADTLAAVHANGLVHGDLRAACVLIDGPIRAPGCRLFGVARTPGERIGLTAARIPPAPEQARGEPPSPAADMHAFGMLLYHLIAGRGPFTRPGARAPSPPALRTGLLMTPPEPLVAPRRLVELVQRLLSKSPSERPTAVDVGHILEHLRDAGLRISEPPRGRRSRMVSRATRPLPRIGGHGITVCGALPAEVVDAITAGGVRVTHITDPLAVDGAEGLLLLAGAPLAAVDSAVAHWPAVLVDSDPGDRTRLATLVRMGVAGVIGTPLDPTAVSRAITRALRSLDRRG